MRNESFRDHWGSTEITPADSPTGAVGIYERLGFTSKDTRVAVRKPLYQPCDAG